MNPQRWKQIDDLFQRALARDPKSRTDFLNANTQSDPELRREVRSLLDANDRSGAFLESPAEGGVSQLLSLDTEESTGDLIGKRLGAYRVSSVIASGGMGTVLLASRDDDAYQKHVAIKLVKPSAAGTSMARDSDRRRRFTLERQVLAELDHPFIARLLDGGTTDDGRPYLVMEHVRGEPIDEYCTSRKLPLRDRLELFVNVCRAVQHAHQNLIIHRDLKPNNILVTAHGAPKLLDFGLAKLLDPQRSPLGSKHTTAGQLMGTVAYAAPEQLSGSAAQQDTRSDVYALGVILYRVLTGRHPYSVDGTMSDVLRRITEIMPDPPSTIAPRLGDELDTIVLKALAKEQDRRYQSAGDLAADIRRYLDGEPVLARGDSRWYVLRKSARRHRVAISIASIILATITLIAVLTSVQAARLAERSAELARALRLSNIERGRAMAATGSVTEAEQLIWAELLKNTDPASMTAPLATAATDPETDRLAEWALRELYFAHPCDRSLTWDRDWKTNAAPEGRWMVLLSDNASLAVIDVETGETRTHLDASVSRFAPMSYTPDLTGVLLANRNEVTHFELPSGRRLRTYSPGPDQITALHCAERSFVATAETRVTVIDRESGSVRTSVRLPESVLVSQARMNPAETMIAVGCKDGHVRTFDAATGRQIGTPVRPPRHRPRYSQNVAFSPDGRYLAAEFDGADVVVIDLESNQQILHLDNPAGWVNSLGFHPTKTDPALLVASSADKAAYVWEVPSGTLLREFTGHDVQLHEASFSRDGLRIVAIGPQLLRRWELQRHAGVRRLPAEGTVFHATWSPDESLIAAGCGDGDNTIRIFDAQTGRLRRTLRGHTDAVSWIVFEPGANSLLSCGYDGTIRRWALDTPDHVASRFATTSGPDAMIQSMDISPDGTTVAAGSDDGTFRLWNREDGTLLDEVEGVPSHPEARVRIPSVRFSPDGRWLAVVVTPANHLILRDMNSGHEHVLPGHDHIARIARFSPDASTLASAGDDLTIRLWSLQPDDFGRQTATLTGHQQDIWALAFSPDGSMLASSGRSGLVKLWDVNAHQCLATLHVHDDMVFSIEFSRDGRTLLTSSRDRTIGVWNLAHYDRHLEGNRDYMHRRLAIDDAQ